MWTGGRQRGQAERTQEQEKKDALKAAFKQKKEALQEARRRKM